MRIAKLALALALTLPVALSAQTDKGDLKFRGDDSSNGSIGGFAVGPYRADLKNFDTMFADDANVIIWCVDFGHYAPNGGSFDDYWGTSFADNAFLHTRGVTDLGLSGAAAKAKYQQAAWLIEQVGTPGYTAKDVQGTMWSMFNSGAPATGYSNKYASIPASFALTRDWYVLSDNVGRGEASNQEFLYSRASTVVPEPSTYLLMATGLLALGVASRRRRTAAIKA